MSILSALGLKAVGFKRRLPFISFLTWFFSRSRPFQNQNYANHSVHSKQSPTKPAYIAVLLFSLLITLYASSHQFAPVVFIESVIIDVSAPFIGAIQRSFISIKSIQNYFKNMQDLEEELTRVKNHNKELLLANTKLKQAAFLHNESSKSFPLLEKLNAQDILTTRTFQASVLNTPEFGQPMILGFDSTSLKSDMIEKNFTVLGEKGLLGRVVNVGFSSAKVMTIFNASSRVPVDINGVQGIAAGQRTHTLKLIHIKEAQHSLKIGDTVVTSGFGGIFQKGLPVGYISSIENKSIEITPFETGEALHIVTLTENLPHFS